ncbi:DUF1318 domain-containing protein [Solidesulfovibrio sp.]|uniref:DUF1318 domain-containing protein n=1 Tax=Solidesulfovibrio sp. TaxID=2910990 RepID=UPI0026394E57|nr:DUF1318 domain-containing protein [Solidesulfovibrio sp.]
MTTHPRTPAPLALLVLCVLALLPARAFGEDAYDTLFASMQARRGALDDLLLGPARCLGERLDGMLEINGPCSAEARKTAEAENNDRRALNALMAADLGLAPEQVGRERARRNQDRYRQGVQREVRLSPSETAWWDGVPPPPWLVSRVLTLRQARIHAAPDASSPVVRDNLQQYEAFGVIDQKQDPAGETWYRVTDAYVPRIKPPQWSPQAAGWLAQKDAIPWKQALAMRFTNPLNRDPSLFFKDKEALLALARLAPAQRAQRLKDLRERLKDGKAAGTGIIAQEPTVGVAQDSAIFYPLLDTFPAAAEETLPLDGMAARLLDVAARTRSREAPRAAQKLAIDIVFVMDTTESMQPHLDDVLRAMRDFIGASADDDLRFGFVGYRDKDPAFGYVVKEYTSRTLPGREFVSVLADVKAQYPVVKGDDFPECVFQGLDKALESLQWRKDAVRLVFLVGDAPGRDEDGYTARVLRDKAHIRSIAINSFYLRNTKSKDYERQGIRQFKELSATFAGAYGTSPETTHFFPVDAGSSQLCGLMFAHFKEAMQAAEIYAKASASGTPLPPAEPGSLTELIFQQAVLLRADNSLPDREVRGWVCDKVLEKPAREALAPMVLLTRAELEELESRVRELKGLGDAALRGEESTALDFFDLVSRNTRFTMVDPAAVNFRDVFSMPLGINKLPYHSEIMMKTRDDFRNQDIVRDFVRAMADKLRHYEDLLRQQANPRIWKKLNQGARESDRVVALDLDQLP